MEAYQLTYEADSREVAGESRASAIARRTVDIVLAGVAVILLSPVLILLALAVRLESRGPALFQQRRLGREMEPFTVKKFRTMRADADETRHREYVKQLIEQPEEVEPHPESQLYKLGADDRVTRVGRLLRSTSLDELPQLFNVVRGEMSLVGPRPVIPYEAESYPGWYAERFSVKPGITGLWQVSGRNERTYEEMIRLDIDYARRRSLWLDLGILLKTVWVVVRREGVA